MLGDAALKAELAPKLVAQTGWFERNRRADDGTGFFYADVQTQLYDPNTGWFHNVWDCKPLAFEGMWPMVVGAATDDQAWSVLQAFLDPEKFFSPHPIRTVSATQAKREKRMWRGPAWNSMTLWAAGGCIRLGHPEAARQLLEPALVNPTHPLIGRRRTT
jgi:hypothetical protein